MLRVIETAGAVGSLSSFVLTLYFQPQFETALRRSISTTISHPRAPPSKTKRVENRGNTCGGTRHGKSLVGRQVHYGNMGTEATRLPCFPTYIIT